MIIILRSQSQFNDFVDVTRYFFYVYLLLQPEYGSVDSSRDVLLCRNEVTVKKLLFSFDFNG
jgi:hypothetical protein